MPVTAEMPQVAICSVAKCVYNQDESCHAKAITIGDPAEPACDTFESSAIHAKNTRLLAGVGACKASACGFHACSQTSPGSGRPCSGQPARAPMNSAPPSPGQWSKPASNGDHRVSRAGSALRIRGFYVRRPA